jgi:ATP-dependent DNA ligase
MWRILVQAFDDGMALLQAAERHDAPYRSRLSRDWVKVKPWRLSVQ